MKVINNSIIPFEGYLAITLWPFIFVRKGRKLTDISLNHEKIHGKQQVEMLLIFFYLWYVIEWFLKLFIGSGNAYRRISFEREAFTNEKNKKYLENRKHYSWLKYIFN